MIDAASYFNVPLVDLGTVEHPAFKGVLTPQPELSRTRVGITAQFLDNAETYHKKYANTAYFRGLIDTALKAVDFVIESPRILDIGSGSGNSVFPALELFPTGEVIATDLSPNLLAIMKRQADDMEGATERLAVVCVDACHDYVRPSSFDLVIGAAILHHLINPSLAIDAACRALRPGGAAVFFEPFENGSAILRLMYKRILERSEAMPPLRPDVASMFAAIVRDFEIRAGSDKSNPIFEAIDDKWLFTRSYIESAAQRAGFSHITIYPIHSIERPFARQTETYLKLVLGEAADAMPDWAWEIIDEHERFFSAELRCDMLIEGAIVLHS